MEERQNTEEFLLNSYIFLGLFVRSWEMKVGKEESISKIRRMSGYLLNILNPFAGGSGPLATNIYQDKCGWLLDLHVFISQLRGAPSRKDAPSRNSGSLHCSGSGE